MLSQRHAAVVEHAARSTSGGRQDNQDAVVAEPPVFAVADGVGGSRGGGLAAAIAIEVLRSPEAPADLADRARLAHRRIREAAERDPEGHGTMATTLTALAFGEDGASLVHVGDSRSYRLREGHLEQLTEDHSLAQELRRAGTLDTAQAARHPQRSVITRALGADHELAPDSTTIPTTGGDVFLLCSDGLSDVLDGDALASALRRGGPLDAIAEELIAEVERQGATDNISVVLVRLGSR